MTDPRSPDDYAATLARVMKAAASHRHVPTQQWKQGNGVYAFDVNLCDGYDLPSGLVARVTVAVVPS